MKVNMPVTDNEVVLQEGQTLVSKTDLKSIVTYANRAFVDVSGFSESELRGVNHNLVRHPDMPPAAFQDLWNTIQQGRPWIGVVKNRCKSGDFYWVKANVTPIWQGGHIVEYMSVRSKPSREEVAAASALYAEMNGGRVVPLREGRVLTAGDRFGFLAQMRVGAELALAGFVLLGIATLLAVTLLLDQRGDIARDAKAMRGVSYLAAVRDVLQFTPQHRGLTNAFLNGNQTARDKVLKVRRKVDQNLETLIKYDAGEGSEFGLTGELKALHERWESLKGEAFNLAATESFSRHTQLINGYLTLMRTAGERSGVVLDPDLVNNYLSSLLIDHIPQATEKMGQARGLGSGIVARGAFGAGQKERVSVLHAAMGVAIEGVERSLDGASDQSGEVREQLGEVGEKARAGLQSFSGSCSRRVFSMPVRQPSTTLSRYSTRWRHCCANAWSNGPKV